jgi:hypothetical protein
MLAPFRNFDRIQDMANRSALNQIQPARPSRALWTGPEIAKSGDWSFQLSDAAATELRECMAPYKGREISPDGLTEDDFRTPLLNEELTPLRHEIGDDGLGFAVLKGVPIDGFAGQDLEIIHWALGKALGTVVTQGGSLGYIAHVRDLGAQAQKSYYAQVGGPLPMHMDPIDLAGLLCLKDARRGGTNLIVSSAALHNHLLEHQPGVLAQLYSGYYSSIRPPDSGQQEISSERLPVFFRQNDQIYSTYLPEPIRRAEEAGLAVLSEAERGALDVFDREAQRDELVVAIDATPGDALFLNNRTVLHSRTHYDDHEAPEDRRHLLRVWMHMRDWAPMPPHAYHYTLAKDRDEKIFLPDSIGIGL